MPVGAKGQIVEKRSSAAQGIALCRKQCQKDGIMQSAESVFDNIEDAIADIAEGKSSSLPMMRTVKTRAI